MTKQIINIGSSANAKNGDPLRTAFNKVNENFTELYNTAAADLQIPLQTNNGGKYLTTNGTTLSWATVTGGADTGSVTFNGVKVIGAGTASGDGFGYSTLELVPDNNLYATSPGGAFGTSGGQYLIIDPTSPQHVHIRAGGVIDQAAAQLILGGEKANVTVRDQDNSYTENHFVTINTADNLGTPYSWNFNNNGDLALPINGGIVFDRANTSIRVGMGFHIASGEGVDIQAIDETDPNNLLYKNWYFSPLGTLTVPSPTNSTFPVVFSPANYVPTGGKPVLTLTDIPWALTGSFAYASDGRAFLMLDNIWPTVINPGYESGDAFTFNSTVHGISGYTLTITLTDVVLAGPAGWTANIVDSAAPVYQPTIESNGAVKITANTSSLIFGTDGALSLPGNIESTNSISLQAGDAVSITTNNTVAAQTWTFDETGTLTFPDATVQTTAYQKVNVPTHSYGVDGDVAGMLAFDQDYIYYCKQNFVAVGPGTTVTLVPNELGQSVNTLTITKSAPPNTNWATVQVGWTLTVDSTTVTIEEITDIGTDISIVVSGFVALPPTGSITFTEPAGTQPNIWKRIAWSADTW